MASASPTVYLIRHGEKDEDPITGEDHNGLSAVGLSRAQQLVQVFGSTSPYNISCILAQHPKKSGKRIRPKQTVQPLADSLPTDLFNTDIDRDDIPGVVAFVKQYTEEHRGDGNILICWEHKQLNDIATAIIQSDSLGSAGAEVAEYPGDRFDIIWTIDAPYDKIDAVTSEHCTPQDDAFRNDP